MARWGGWAAKPSTPIIACALVLGAFAAPVSQAADQRSPGSGTHAAPVTRFNGLANLGREGNGLVAHKSRAHHKAQAPYNVFANLGVEGSGLIAPLLAVPPRPWAN